MAKQSARKANTDVPQSKGKPSLFEQSRQLLREQKVEYWLTQYELATREWLAHFGLVELCDPKALDEFLGLSNASMLVRTRHLARRSGNHIRKQALCAAKARRNLNNLREAYEKRNFERAIIETIHMSALMERCDWFEYEPNAVGKDHWVDGVIRANRERYGDVNAKRDNARQLAKQFRAKNEGIQKTVLVKRIAKATGYSERSIWSYLRETKKPTAI